MLVAKIIDEPNPWNRRAVIKNTPEVDNPHKILEMPKIMTPKVNIFFLPTISANLLNGIGKIAEVSRKTETIQLREMAFIENSLAMTGNAKFIADPINGTKVVAIQKTSNMELRYDFESANTISI